MFHLSTIIWFSIALFAVASISVLIAVSDTDIDRRRRNYHKWLAGISTLTFLAIGIAYLNGFGCSPGPGLPYSGEFSTLFALTAAIEFVRVYQNTL